jgi:uncharacterized membrane protein
MRQIFMQATSGDGAQIVRRAADRGAKNIATVPANGDGRDCDLIILHLPNDEVEPFLDDIEGLGELEVSINPNGVYTLDPPVNRPEEDHLETRRGSSLEIAIEGLNSAGTWAPLFGYAGVAGMVVWIGLYGGTWFLLTAAMLIAPFAGPAMNTAIASATGDLGLMRHATGRYFAGIATTAAVAALLTGLVGPEMPTTIMSHVTSLSAFTVLLPVAAGAAGALYLIYAGQTSLISGAAVGILVAASLAPPSGAIGMAAVMGRWDIVSTASFVIALQLVGINAAATALLRVSGVSHLSAREGRAHSRSFPITMAASLVAVVALVVLQQYAGTPLQRTTVALEAEAAIDDAVTASGIGRLVDTDIWFTPYVEEADRMIAVVYVAPIDGDGGRVTWDDRDAVETEVEGLVAEAFTGLALSRPPLIDVVLLAPAG